MTTGNEELDSDLRELSGAVDRLFTPQGVAGFLPEPGSLTESAAYNWVLQDGKRLRPLLTLATFAALARRPAGSYANHAALAVEILHKASLIHDDIEDGDTERYGKATIHSVYGVPFAINVGDFLIGEGYRIVLMGGGDSAETRSGLVRVIAEGQRRLTLGQGAELEALRGGKRFESRDDYFRLADNKTGAAFEVAILLGATLAEADDSALHVLRRFSRAFGIAYQIADDLADIDTELARDIALCRPNILITLAAESPNRRIARILREPEGAASPYGVETVRVFREEGLVAKALSTGNEYKTQALDSLGELGNPRLAGFLRYLASRSLGAAD